MIKELSLFLTLFKKNLPSHYIPLRRNMPMFKDGLEVIAQNPL